MNDFPQQLAELSPEKRLLLALRNPLSFSQQRLWFLDQLEPGNPFYNIAIALQLKGKLRVSVLERSFREIVRRHAILRTTFPDVDGRPVQVIAQDAAVSQILVNLQALSESDRESRARSLVEEEIRRPFTLAGGPLMRTMLLKLGKDHYVFLMTMHHIIADAWSKEVLISELTRLYEAFSEGRPSPLEELPIQFADFAHWQREWLRGDELEAQLSYWKKRLVDIPPMLELPTDRPRPAIQTHRGSTQSRVIPGELYERLKQLSQSEGATLFMTSLAAFNVLLYRYTGREDILVGVPIANRGRAETQSLIGFFLNTLVLRTDLSGNPTFLELLRRVREATLSDFARQDLPFEKLVDEIQPDRSFSHNPLFQVMFTLKNASFEPRQSPELEISKFELSNNTSKFDLTLGLVEGSDRSAAAIEYNTDLFDDATITRMLDHFEALLNGIVANPRQRLLDLPMLTEGERHQVLVQFNDTIRDCAFDTCLQVMFEDQARKTPNAVAVVFEDQRLSYDELNSRANQLAHRLRSVGVEPDTPAAICMNRSTEMVIGLLGILKAGGAYVPLDPAYPQERLAFMLEDIQSPVLLAQQTTTANLPAHHSQTICLDSDWESISRESRSNPTVTTNPDNLAYIIYTSGSTGTPKAVMNTHRGICNRLLWMQDELSLTLDDRLLQKTPFTFDVSVWEFFWPLLTGARLVVAKPQSHQDSSYLASLIASEDITVLHFVPSMLQVFLQEDNLESCRSLRQVICSGEALPFDLQERFFVRLSASLYNLYGPTEASVDVTWWACSPLSDRSTVPIGHPISNTQIYLLDKQMNPVPVGVYGELFIGGVSLARGYLNRAELTAEKFIPDPFSESGAARLYRTGDLARYLSDGRIEFLGRIDHQVKLRGYRIELGEIEAILMQHAAVSEAVVAVKQRPGAGEQIVGYVVIKEEVSGRQLRSYLGEKLPGYMVPAVIVEVEKVPLNANGKVDRGKLPEVEWNKREGVEGAVRARDAAEEVIAGIWGSVLGVEEVGVRENFFELGGHSLLATQVVSRVQDAFRVEFELQKLFESPTVEGMVNQIAQVWGGREIVEEIARTLQQVEMLSADEVAATLSLNSSYGND